MTPQANPSLEIALTFLVSQDGIATLSAGLDLAPLDERRPAAPVEATFDRGAWAIGTVDDPVEMVERTANTKDVAALVGVARRLAADAFQRQVTGEKTRRQAASAKAEVAAIPGRMAAFDAFVLVSRGCLDQVSTNARLLCQGGDAEALHQCRVGLRRLRAALTTFRRILPPDDLDRWQLETRWLAGALDAARELDAFIGHVARSTKAPVQGDPVLAAFGERLVLARAIACDAAVAAIQSPRFTALVLNFTDWLEAGSWTADDDREAAALGKGHVSILAALSLERLRGQVHKDGKHLRTLDPAGRHAVRIKAKKLRYAAEFFSETFGKDARKQHVKFIEPLTELLDALGELNDMATAGSCARAVVGGNAELAFRAGEIVGRRDSEEPRLLAGAVRAHRHWSAAQPFWA